MQLVQVKAFLNVVSSSTFSKVSFLNMVAWMNHLHSEKDLKRPSHNKQLVNMLANCWRQIKLVPILTNLFTNIYFFMLVNRYLTCERLANNKLLIFNMFLNCCCVFHTCQLEFANMSLPT